MKLESATRVTVIRSLQVVVSFVVQILVWNELPAIDQVKPSHPIYVMKTVKSKQNIQLKMNNTSEYRKRIGIVSKSSLLKTTLIVFVIIDFPIFRN